MFADASNYWRNKLFRTLLFMCFWLFLIDYVHICCELFSIVACFNFVSLPPTRQKFKSVYFSRNSDYFKWIHRMKKRVINSCHPSFERFFRNSFQTRGKILLHCCWIVRRKNVWIWQIYLALLLFLIILFHFRYF